MNKYSIIAGFLCSIPVWTMFMVLRHYIYIPYKSNLVWDKYINEGMFDSAPAKLVKWHSHYWKDKVYYSGSYEYIVCGKTYKKNIDFSDLPPDNYTIYYRKGKPHKVVSRYDCCPSVGIISWLVVWILCSVAMIFS